MKNESNVRLNFLDKANGATSILAILAAVSAFPGGLKLYEFMMDASDSKIEPAHLTGLGDMTVPGLGYVLKEPYSSLVLYALAVIIPVLILIALLVKKRGLGKNKLVGRGLYWLIILLGIGGILGGLGILTKLVANNLGSPFSIDTAPGNLAFTAGSILAILTAWFAVNFLSQAGKAPGVDQLHEDDAPADVIEERRGSRYVQDDGISERDFVPAETVMDPARAEAIPASEASDASAVPDEILERTFTQDTVVIPQGEAAALSAEATLNTPPELLVTAPGLTAADGMAADDTKIQPAGSAETEEPSDSPADEAGAVYAATEWPEAQTPVLKRKLISFPGDDTKVIVVMREYMEDELVREWAEIHSKSEFTRKA